jgi:hypothetical protein
MRTEVPEEAEEIGEPARTHSLALPSLTLYLWHNSLFPSRVTYASTIVHADLGKARKMLMLLFVSLVLRLLGLRSLIPLCLRFSSGKLCLELGNLVILAVVQGPSGTGFCGKNQQAKGKREQGSQPSPERDKCVRVEFVRA